MATVEEAEKVEEDRHRQETDRLNQERNKIRNMKAAFALFSICLLLVLLLTYFLNQ